MLSLSHYLWLKDRVHLQAEVEARPLLYNNFMTVAADDTPIYNVVPGYEQLRKTLNDKLAEYNESNAVMDLVLFQQAMEHICRITRIISLPRGNAMLVGVGGSGKQSLARLASFICGYEVFQIAVSSSYGVADFKENLLALYTKVGSSPYAHCCGLATVCCETLHSTDTMLKRIIQLNAPSCCCIFLLTSLPCLHCLSYRQLSL